MIKKISHKNMGSSNQGWLNSLFHFSFADYYNPDNTRFGVLRVVNDDFVGGKTGFDMHFHRDMEIVSYVVDGYLSHEDSLGNKGRVGRGNVQYMSAGSGIQHSEHNHEDETLRLLQIWIFPDQKGHNPAYGEFSFTWEDRVNQWLHLVSPKDGDAPVKIHQDANFYVLALDKKQEINFPLGKNRQAYLVQIEGTSEVNGEFLDSRDAAEVVGEEIRIKGEPGSHYILIEMKIESRS